MVNTLIVDTISNDDTTNILILLSIECQYLNRCRHLTRIHYIYLFILTQITPDNKAVLITGCDTGFGHALALHLDKLVSLKLTLRYGDLRV